MKKIFFIAILIVLGAFVFISRESNPSINNPNFFSSKAPPQEEEEFIFVPHWTFSEEINTGDESLIYFGISVNSEGIDKTDQGYAKVKAFSELKAGDKYLTLIIIGEDSTELLNNTNLQRRIGQEASLIALEYGFKGVVIDFETSAFGFSSTEGKITNLYKNLHSEIKKEDLEFLVTVFGDNYYRARPYHIKTIGELSDKVIIMAYDFHKARLNPGPNFPFSGKDKYGYDFKTMIEDFKKDLSFEKIIVALGYFGYDWKLEDGSSIEMAEPLSLNQITSRFVESCSFENCKLEKNSDIESVVRYQDDEGFSHEVWFESKESSEKKIEYLNSIGINQIAFWAYSYY